MKFNKNVIIYSVVIGSVFIVGTLLTIKCVSNRKLNKQPEKVIDSSESSDAPKASAPAPENQTINANSSMVDDEKPVKQDTQDLVRRPNSKGNNIGFKFQPDSQVYLPNMNKMLNPENNGSNVFPLPQVSNEVVNGQPNFVNNGQPNFINNGQNNFENPGQIHNQQITSTLINNKQEQKNFLNRALEFCSNCIKKKKIEREVFLCSFVYDKLDDKQYAVVKNNLKTFLRDTDLRKIFSSYIDNPPKNKDDMKKATLDYLKLLNEKLLKHYIETPEKTDLLKNTNNYLILLRSQSESLVKNIENDKSFKKDFFKLIFFKNFNIIFENYIKINNPKTIEQNENATKLKRLNNYILVDLQNIRNKKQRKSFYNQYSEHINNSIQVFNETTIYDKSLLSDPTILTTAKPTDELFNEVKRA